MQYEVEQKFPLKDSSRLESQLSALGATRHEPIEQTDTYFAHPARDFAETDEALRIRQSDGKNLITYKGPKLDQTTKTRREIELPLSDGTTDKTTDRTSAEQYGELLEALGFRRVAEVKKTRVPVTINWQGRSVEGALDEVAGLGSYVELEVVTDQAGLEAAKACVVDLAQHLGLGQSERRSYLELLLE